MLRIPRGVASYLPMAFPGERTLPPPIEGSGRHLRQPIVARNSGMNEAITRHEPASEGSGLEFLLAVHDNNRRHETDHERRHENEKDECDRGRQVVEIEQRRDGQVSPAAADRAGAIVVGVPTPQIPERWCTSQMSIPA